MVKWKEFAAAMPEMAQAGRSLLNQHTRWENVLKPGMRSVHQTWRAP